MFVKEKGNNIIPKVEWNDLFYLKHFSFFVEKKRGIEKWWSNLSLSHLINQLLRDHKQSYSTSTFQIKEGQQEKGKPMLEEQKDQNRYLYTCETGLHTSQAVQKEFLGHLMWGHWNRNPYQIPAYVLDRFW